MGQASQGRVKYAIDKMLGDELAIARCVTDGEPFLRQEFDIDRRPELSDVRALYYRGAYRPVAEILNHENLVGVTGPIRELPFRGVGGGENEMCQYILWDWCDAGTLDNILREPPRAPTDQGFLPESLVWHVAISVLKALMWLHEGWRQRPDATQKSGTGLYKNDDDWMPVLHRQIAPRNIYFQSPRGIETYGRCKLGNFGNCHVSGSLSAAVCIDDRCARTSDGSPESKLERKGWAITSKDADVPLRSIKKAWDDGVSGGWDFSQVHESQRPYTVGSELFSLGATLYRMMVGLRLPDPDRCHLCPCSHLNPPQPCTHFCEPDVHLDKIFPTLTKYTQGLRDVVDSLLRANRSPTERAVEAYAFALDRYSGWKTNTPDGRLFVDELDDRHFRLENEQRRRRGA